MSKVVHIMLAGPVTDGWTYQDNMLTKYQHKIGYDVTMITSRWVWGTDGKLEKTIKTNYINEDGVKVIRLELSGKDQFEKKYKRYIGLGEALEEEKPDILFIHNISFGDVNKVVEYIKKNPNVKVYADNHSDFSNSGGNWLSRNILHKIIWKRNAQKLEPYVTKFYGVLPARVDWLKEMYGLPEEKCELLVMGGDDEEIEKANDICIKEALRKKYNIANDDFLIVSGGKIDNAKKQTLLLMEAVKKISNEKVKLIVFGSVEESLKKEVEQRTDNNRVQYIGWIKGSDSYKYFATADLVVFPGRHSVFWEQVVAQGIPLICKYWKGTTHVDLGGNVEFLYNDSSDEIQKRIENLLIQENYLKMYRVAQEKKILFQYSEIAKKSISG